MRNGRLFALAAVVAGMAMMGGSARAVVALPPPLRGRPVPPAGWGYQWVPPVYQTVAERQWAAERRDLVTDWVEVGPGRWAQVMREVVVVPGHWEVTTRQVQVSGGYWQLVRVDPPPYVPAVPLPRPVVLPGAVGVDGYQSAEGGEDLSRFSGLSEWPGR